MKVYRAFDHYNVGAFEYFANKREAKIQAKLNYPDDKKLQQEYLESIEGIQIKNKADMLHQLNFAAQNIMVLN